MKKSIFLIICLLCAMIFTGCDPQAAHRPTGQWEWNGANTKISIDFNNLSEIRNGFIETNGVKTEFYTTFAVAGGLRFFYMSGDDIEDYDHCVLFSGIYLWGKYKWSESQKTLTFTSAPIVNRDSSLKLVFHQVESAE